MQKITSQSVSPSQAQALEETGRFGADRLRRLRDNVDEPIAAILSINTIAHTLGAAWFGSLVSERYADGSSALAVGTAVFTVAILLLSEIIPKSLGVNYARQLGPLIAWPQQLMIWSAWPVVKASAKQSLSTLGLDSILYLMGLSDRHTLHYGDE